MFVPTQSGEKGSPGTQSLNLASTPWLTVPLCSLSFLICTMAVGEAISLGSPFLLQGENVCGWSCFVQALTLPGGSLSTLLGNLECQCVKNTGLGVRQFLVPGLPLHC